MSEEQKDQEQPKYTDAQLETMRKERMAWYKKEIPVLKAQAEYEELLTKIDVAKMTRVEIMMAQAQMMRGPQDENARGVEERPTPEEHVRPANQSASESKPNRKLKAEK